MNTVDDLRRTFAEHLPAVPETAGMVAAAHAGVARIRRRRRITATVAAAIAALLVAVGIPLAAHRSTMPARPVPARSAADMTIDLADGATFMVTQRAADGARQLLVAGANGFDGLAVGSDIRAGEVWAYDPDAFRPADLPPGRTVRVGGHDALLVPALTKQRYAELQEIGAFTVSPSTPPGAYAAFIPEFDATVVWRDQSGIWIAVTGTERRDVLLALAAAVRVREPRPPAGPVGLSWLPSGLAVTHAETFGVPLREARIGLSTPEPGTNAVAPPSHGPGSTSVEISIEPRAAERWRDGMRLPAPALRVAGHAGWYFHGETPGYTFGRSEGRLLIDTGSCGIRVDVADDSVVTSDQVLTMMSRATYGSCADETGWVPMVG